MLRCATSSAPSPPAWRPDVTRQLAFSTIDGRIELVNVDSTKTTWLSRSGRPADPARLVGRRPAPARARRAVAARLRLEREQALVDRDARRALGRRLRPQEPPVHPHPLLARDPAQRPRAVPGRDHARRAALPLLGARATSGRWRSPRTASGCSSAGSTRTSGCSCGSRRPRSSPFRTSSSSSAARREHRSRGRSRIASAGAVPRRPDPLRRRRGRSSGAVQAIDRADPVAPVAVGRPAVGRAARPGRAASG